MGNEQVDQDKQSNIHVVSHPTFENAKDVFNNDEANIRLDTFGLDD